MPLARFEPDRCRGPGQRGMEVSRMSVSRRRFIEGSVAAGGALAGAKFLFEGSETVGRVAEAAEKAPTEDFFPTACWIGKQDCSMLARRIDGRVVKFDGLVTNPRNKGTLCPKGQAQIMAIYDPHRVKTPLIRTNGKGEHGEWKEASWEDALALCASRLNEVRAEDPELVIWQKGRSKVEPIYDDAFVEAIRATKVGHGGYCSDAGYRAMEYTWGLHGVLHPDFKYTDYVLSWGWNLTNAGGNKTCFITWSQQLVEARESRGTKVVQIDPRLRPAGPFADAWLPVRPGTDLALALALCNVVIASGHLDRPYLQRYTNAAYLVRADGSVVRNGDVEMVWDNASGGPAPLASATDPALEGFFEVDGQAVRPAFQVFKDEVAEATPEWAGKICGVDPRAIQEIGQDFGERAQIGSTIVVDGVEVPHRPVSIMAYHMGQQELGFQTVRAMALLSMLVGAPGAAGGQTSDYDWKIHKNYAKFAHLKVEDPPYGPLVKDSKYFPINSGLPGIYATAINDPATFEVDPETLPRAAIVHMTNPVVAYASQPDVLEGFKKIPFTVVLSPWLSETADLVADVVLPVATIEKYEGPLSADTQYVEAKTMRLPPMEPLFESKGEIDIYLDLTDAMGVLTGEEGFVANINKALELKDPYKLPTDRKPTARDVMDMWSLSQGLEGGLKYFEKQGVWVKGTRKPTKRYGYVTTKEDGSPNPFGGVLHRFYGESLLQAQQAMQAKGADEVYWRLYTPLPVWQPPTMLSSPEEYDLTLISYKLIAFKQSRASFVPLLSELEPEQRVDLNPATAHKRGIGDGDTVWVESHNAITGKTRKVKVRAALTEGMRPDVAGMPHHFGLTTMPWTKGQGPTPNALFFTGPGYVANTADQSFQVRVKVYPEGSES